MPLAKTVKSISDALPEYSSFCLKSVSDNHADIVILICPTSSPRQCDYQCQTLCQYTQLLLSFKLKPDKRLVLFTSADIETNVSRNHSKGD